MSPAQESQLVPLLERIAALLETLPDRMTRTTTASPLSAEDRAYLQRLLPAVSEAIGDRCVWAVADLYGHADNHDALRGAIGDRNRRSMGKLLSRAEGVVVGECLLRRGEEVREGWLWQVDRV